MTQEANTPIVVVDGPHAHLSVAPSENRTAALSLGLGQGGPATMHLTDGKAVELIEALRVHLRESDCSQRCTSENDVHGRSNPDRGWHRDDCPAQLERTTVEDLYGIIAELVRELEDAGVR